MNLFLCSHFSKVGALLKDHIVGKRVAFIPTASIHEGYTGYVGSARTVFKKLGAELTEIEISTANVSDITQAFDAADIIYFTGGNSFFLIDQLRKTGTDTLLKQQLEKGKLFIGESAGAIVCAPELSYIEKMDPIPKDYSQNGCTGLNLIDFYVLPHYLTASFKKITAEIMQSFPNIELCAINNAQAVIVKDGKRDVIGKEGN